MGDERRARERLKRMLAVFPDIEIAGEAGDGLSALRRFNRIGLMRCFWMYRCLASPAST